MKNRIMTKVIEKTNTLSEDELNKETIKEKNDMTILKNSLINKHTTLADSMPLDKRFELGLDTYADYQKKNILNALTYLSDLDREIMKHYYGIEGYVRLERRELAKLYNLPSDSVALKIKNAESKLRTLLRPYNQERYTNNSEYQNIFLEKAKNNDQNVTNIQFAKDEDLNITIYNFLKKLHINTKNDLIRTFSSNEKIKSNTEFKFQTPEIQACILKAIKGLVEQPIAEYENKYNLNNLVLHQDSDINIRILTELKKVNVANVSDILYLHINEINSNQYLNYAFDFLYNKDKNIEILLTNIKYKNYSTYDETTSTIGVNNQKEVLTIINDLKDRNTIDDLYNYDNPILSDDLKRRIIRLLNKLKNFEPIGNVELANPKKTYLYKRMNQQPVRVRTRDFI